MNTLLSTFAQVTYTTTSLFEEETAAGAAVGAGIVTFGLLSVVIAYIIGALLLGQIFKKAGEPAWAAWVPFYNNWKLLEIGGQQGFWAVLSIIPIVNIVSAIFIYIAQYHIGLKLGKSGAFVLLAIFLPIVWLIWLAVDTSKWNEAAEGATPAVSA